MPKETKKGKDKKVKQKKNFLKDTKAELKKVIWPTPKQLSKNTLAVLSIVILIGLIVFVLDVCFDKINAYGIESLKSAVRGNTETTQEVTESSEDISIDQDGAVVESVEMNPEEESTEAGTTVEEEQTEESAE